MIFAGCVVLLSVALSHFVSPWWLLLTVFAGLNMIQSGITGFCPAANLFKWMGLPVGCAFSSEKGRGKEPASTK